MPLINKLIRNVLTNVVSIIDKEEDFVTKVGPIPLAQVAVKLLIKSHVIFRFDAQHSIAAITLIDMVDVVETARAKVLEN
mmetsp:Transcript_16932/g.32359  ORF Transcript_16932/g.32359 Transcript_16932/m.32359 type:complete len:80 (-) Transcript_16932:751-990(-)